MSENAPARVDWVKNRSLVAWGLPAAALLAGSFLPDPLRTAVWTLSLIWMGGACLANARRCGRTHCYFTGPFFLLMAAASIVHGLGLVDFGPSAWRWLGMTIGAGAAILWIVPERLLGTYLGGGAGKAQL